MRREEAGGSILLIYVMISVLFIGLFSVLHILNRNVSWGVKEQKNLTAFEMAQTGINNAYHWLKEDPSRWKAVATNPVTLSSTTMAGLASLAEVTVTISSGSSSAQRNMLSTARVQWSKGTRMETRTLQATVETNTNPAAVWAGQSARFGGTVSLHWGPVYCNQDIQLLGAAATKGYTRKYARGKIYVNGTQVTGDGVEYFPERSDLPTIPSVDLDVYLASASVQTDGGDPVQGTRNPPGRNVYEPASNGWVKFSGIIDPHPNDSTVAFYASSDTRVRYVKGNLRMQNCYLQGTLIVLGDLVMTGQGVGKYKTSIPPNALDEYQKINQSLEEDEFPGDLGSTLNTHFKFGAAPLTTWKDGTEDTIGFNGFIYVTGSLQGVGGQVIHGAIWTVLDDAGTSGTFQIFYRNDLNILTSQVTPDFVIKDIRAVTP